MQNVKLRLDYLRSKKVNLAEGDVFTSPVSGKITVEDGGDVENSNESWHRDNECFIESFAPRKNTGVQPVGDDVPVVCSFGTSNIVPMPARLIKWDLATEWSPHLESMIKMQIEHDATQDKIKQHKIEMESAILSRPAPKKPKKTKALLQTGEPFEHTKTLNFILSRMIEVHGEHESVDYIHKLRNAIVFVEVMEDSANTAVECSKPKKTKVEYVRVKFDKLSEAFAEHETNPLYDSRSADMAKALTAGRIVTRFNSGASLYRKVETEITWRDEAAENFNVIFDGGQVGVLPISESEYISMCNFVVSNTSEVE